MEKGFDFRDFDKKLEVERLVFEDLKKIEEGWSKRNKASSAKLSQFASLSTIVEELSSLEKNEKNKQKEIEEITVLSKLDTVAKGIKLDLKAFGDDFLLMVKLKKRGAKFLTEKKMNSKLILANNEFYGFLVEIVGMYKKELDLKELIYLGLSEFENAHVLNTYLIVWKNQPFLDFQRKKEIRRICEMNFKLRTVLS